MVKFEVFETGATEATHVDTLGWDPETDSAATIEALKNKVLEYAKKKNVVMGVNGPDAAWILGQRKRPGRQVHVDPDVVKVVHHHYVDRGVPVAKIPFRVFEECKDTDGNGIEIKEGVIRSILFQKRGTEVEGIDDLREKALAKIDVAARIGRRKYTDADHDEWVRRHVEDGESGSAIAKDLEINSSIVNAVLRKRNVQRNRRS